MKLNNSYITVIIANLILSFKGIQTQFAGFFKSSCDVVQKKVVSRLITPLIPKIFSVFLHIGYSLRMVRDVLKLSYVFDPIHMLSKKASKNSVVSHGQPLYALHHFA